MRYEKTFNEKTRRKRLAAELAEPKANSSAASEANNETVDHIEEEKAVGENELIEDARTRQAIGNKNLQCDHCELTTRSKSILTRYMKLMHIEQTAIVQGDHCDDKSHSPNNVQNHINLVHGD